MTAAVVDLAQYKREKYDPSAVELPSEVLPDPSRLHGAMAFDLETTGLHYDDGATVCAVGVAYRVKDDLDSIWYHAFPFDQGNAEEKGFKTHYWPELPEGKKLTLKQLEMPKYKYAGKPLGDPEGLWNWDIDVNLPVQEWVTLCRWLQEAGKAVGLTNQNLKFDLGLFRAGTRFCEGIELEKYAVWDTMLASPLIWPYAGTTALKPVAARIWGEDAVSEAEVVKLALAEVKKRYNLKVEHGPRYDLLPW